MSNLFLYVWWNGWWFVEELVEVDTFYDDYQEKKVEMVVVQDEALLPKEKEHWGYDTVGEGNSLY